METMDIEKCKVDITENRVYNVEKIKKRGKCMLSVAVMENTAN